jgi:MYXO-CTERM domain-containing protein
VDRPRFAHTPASNAAGATAQYFGGPVAPNPKVYVVWWGDPAKINSVITAAHGGIADFFTGITNSSFMDWLNEYSTNITVQAGSHMGMAGTGQLIGRGNYAGALTLSNIPSGNVTDAQVQSTLDQAFVAGTLPLPDDNTLYAIYFPPGVSISLDGSTSCQGFGAYHEAIIETQRHNAYYLVIPDCGSSFKSITSVSTHEFVEALTDVIPTPANMPDYPQAWNDSMGNEMGDLCEGSNGTVMTGVGTFTVQAIWDERTHACKTFSSDANDFNVAISPNVATVELNAKSTFMVQTATSAGTAQTLTLSAVAPTGVTATVSPTTIMSGATATLTVTATNPSAQTGLQVVVRADTSGSTVQTHTAALLLSTMSSPMDLGAPPADLAQAAASDLALAHSASDLALAAGDLAQAPGVGGVGSPDDLAVQGPGGTPKPAPKGGCGCVIGASANTSTLDSTWALALVALAFLLAALRRRQPRA